MRSDCCSGGVAMIRMSILRMATVVMMMMMVAMILQPREGGYYSGVRAWTCEPYCGGIPLNYPFGYGGTCGSPEFQPYVNCSSRGTKLLFYTPTGTYVVQTIDYTNNIMIVVDPHMSTCSQMQLSGSFGLPVGSPFSFAAYDTVALLGCSSTSSLYAKRSCDTSASGQQICEALYGCPGATQLAGSATDSCCVLSGGVLQTAPYEIDLPLLQCSSYSSVYRIGNIQSPSSSWSFGIALQFNPGSQSSSSSSPNGQRPTCYVCQQAEESEGSTINRLSFTRSYTLGLITLLGFFMIFC